MPGDPNWRTTIGGPVGQLVDERPDLFLVIADNLWDGEPPPPTYRKPHPQDWG